MELKHINRRNAKKSKQGCGCKMCKPHKGGWVHKFKPKDRSEMNNIK